MSEHELQEPLAPTPIHLGMLLLAGAGSLAAQRDARDAALAVAGTDDAPLSEAIAVAEVMGWQAVRSGEVADFRALASILLRRADELSQKPCHRVFAFGHVINLLDLAAEAGDAGAATMLEDALSRAPADAIPQAKMLKADWLDTIEHLNSVAEGLA